MPSKFDNESKEIKDAQIAQVTEYAKGFRRSLGSCHVDDGVSKSNDVSTKGTMHPRQITSETNLHAGHRQRMLHQILNSDPKSIHPHQALEFLLMYTIPRIDTNPTAHRLMNHFGSLDNVFSASAEELMQVKGIGPKSADMLVRVSNIIRIKQKKRSSRKRYTDIFELAVYVREYCAKNELDDSIFLFPTETKLLPPSCAILLEGDCEVTTIPPECTCSSIFCFAVAPDYMHIGQQLYKTIRQIRSIGVRITKIFVVTKNKLHGVDSSIVDYNEMSCCQLGVFHALRHEVQRPESNAGSTRELKSGETFEYVPGGAILTRYDGTAIFLKPKPLR